MFLCIRNIRLSINASNLLGIIYIKLLKVHCGGVVVAIVDRCHCHHTHPNL